MIEFNKAESDELDKEIQELIRDIAKLEYTKTVFEIATQTAQNINHSFFDQKQVMDIKEV